MYRVIIILLFSLLCFSCKQNIKPEQAFVIDKAMIPRDTIVTAWYPIDLSKTKNTKLCLEYCIKYKHWKVENKPFTSVISRKLNILYYSPADTFNNMNKNGNKYKTRSNFKIIYSTNESDSLIFDANQESIKYYGNDFIVFFSKWTETGKMDDVPEDEKGYLLYEPIVFYIDTVNVRAIKLKNNPKMKAYSGVNHKNARPFIHSNGSGFDRNFAFSIKNKEFVFGRRSRGHNEY